MNQQPLTFHNDPAAKALRIQECKADMETDRLLAETYSKGECECECQAFRGCSIGCQIYNIALRKKVTLDELLSSKPSHQIVADDYGWPLWLCHLEDAIFEGLPEERRAQWPLSLMLAVPVGVDIGPVIHLFMLHLVNDMLPQSFDVEKHKDVADAIKTIATLHERAATGDMPTKKEWAAGWATADASDAVDRDIADSAAWEAADATAWIEMADKLIELLNASSEASS